MNKKKIKLKNLLEELCVKDVTLLAEKLINLFGNVLVIMLFVLIVCLLFLLKLFVKMVKFVKKLK